MDDLIATLHRRAAFDRKRAKEVRIRARLTQGEVGKLLGCSHAAISRWESGDRVPKSTVDLDAYVALIERLEEEF